ncbi:MAG: hypothetical protein CMQ41_09490 [Gammaproteobacteria bacterium]|nr:hypothetical protein [Gammaproteobacteria bacterium]|tara:strand:- start:2328 stop:2840 length:513 start_codon:yes stop_codon:yes gene_type:complete
MELLSTWGEFLGGIGVIISLIFLGIQTRTANRLALASSQREQRHIWQEMMFFMANHSSEYREFLHNYEDMDPDRQTKAVMALFAMGNQLDMLLKLNAEGLETDDNLRYVMDAFVGHMSTPGGYKFWQAMSDIDLYGDNVLNAVNERLKEMDVPNEDFVNALHWLKPDKVF